MYVCVCISLVIEPSSVVEISTTRMRKQRAVNASTRLHQLQIVPAGSSKGRHSGVFSLRYVSSSEITRPDVRIQNSFKSAASVNSWSSSRNGEKKKKKKYIFASNSKSATVVRNNIRNKKAQLSLTNPRDVKVCQNCSNSTCLQRCR